VGRHGGKARYHPPIPLDLHRLLTATYSPNALSFVTVIVSVAILLLGAGVLIRGRKLAASRLFFVISLAVALWQLSFAVMYAAGDATTAAFWARLNFFLGSLIVPAMFQFAAEVVGGRRHYRWQILLFWLACAGAGLAGLLTNAFMSGVRSYSWGWYAAGRPAGGIVVLGFSAILIATIHLFWRAYKTSEGKARERAVTLLLAVILGTLAMFDYLPSSGIDVQPAGWVAALAFFVLAATAVWRFELADITPEFAAGQILETMKGAVLVSDMSGAIRVANRAAVNLLGYKPEELRGAHLRSILPPSQNQTTGQLINSMGVLEHSMAWRAADGSNIDVLAASSFLRDEDGSPVGVVYVASDYTERKRAEQALRESEHRYRTLFEMNPLPMWVYDFETLVFTAVNDAALRHYGYSRAEFLKMKITDIRPVEEIPRMLETLRSLGERRGPQPFRHRKKDGTIFDAEITSFEFITAGRRARLAIAQDVTERNRAQEELRRSEERYRELFENANDLIYTHDLQGIVLSMNVACERVTGYSADEVLGRFITDLVAPEHHQRGIEAMQKKARGEVAATSYELDIISKDGRRVPVEVNTRLIYENGRPVAIQGIGRDISERKDSEARFRLLFERNLAGVYRTTIDGRILDCNEACARIFGYESREEFLGLHAGDFYFDNLERERIVKMLGNQQSISNLELHLRRRDGSAMWVLENVTLLDNGVMEGTIIDITDRKHALEQMEYQAYHDALTSLPNRLLFRDRIGVAQAHAKRNGRCVAVMFLDLDQFKLVNDTLGHTVGDRLLQAIASRLVNCVRAEDTVARMGGDEFTILLVDLSDRRNAGSVAQKVLDAVRHPVRIDEHELYVTTSIGIAIYPEDGDDAEALLKNADRAMYRAKEAGRDNYQYAAGALHEASDSRLDIERALHHALERDELVVHYQPKAEFSTGRILSAEALVRWQHPKRGLLLPAEFLPLAESWGLMRKLTRYVLDRALAQCAAWHADGLDIGVAVNLSLADLLDEHLAKDVAGRLRQFGLEPGALRLEITEDIVMAEPVRAGALIDELAELGVCFSLDDFGTGHSSLAYLKRLPVDELKIDRSFVTSLTAGGADAAIVQATIMLGRSLGLRVVAEGVESGEAWGVLDALGCHEAQGFFLARPAPAESLTALLHERSAAGLPTADARV
jgi:diguanylate cyclase (GGDEF)-like protein/PAS domain S-box-containing protein